MFWYEIKAVEHENIVDKISGKLRLKQKIIDELVETKETYNPEAFLFQIDDK